jgi:hypothetical protein
MTCAWKFPEMGGGSQRELSMLSVGHDRYLRMPFDDGTSHHWYKISWDLFDLGRAQPFRLGAEFPGFVQFEPSGPKFFALFAGAHEHDSAPATLRVVSTSLAAAVEGAARDGTAFVFPLEELGARKHGLGALVKQHNEYFAQITDNEGNAAWYQVLLPDTQLRRATRRAAVQLQSPEPPMAISYEGLSGLVRDSTKVPAPLPEAWPLSGQVHLLDNGAIIRDFSEEGTRVLSQLAREPPPLGKGQDLEHKFQPGTQSRGHAERLYPRISLGAGRWLMRERDALYLREPSLNFDLPVWWKLKLEEPKRPEGHSPGGSLPP